MRSLILFLLLFVFLPARADDPAPFEIREGDRVVLLGDALLERENTYGYLETRMHEQFPDRKFIVRNLSWAGDTPRGWSRASFDPPEKGYERLKEAIALVKPTVVFLGYGMAASLQEMTDRAQDITLNRDEARYGSEPMSAARFKKELGELMDAISQITGTANAEGAENAEGRRGPKEAKPNPSAPLSNPSASSALNKPGPPAKGVRFVLLSPIRHEDLRAVRPGLPDPAPHNALLEQYSKAIEELAKEKGARQASISAGSLFDSPKTNPSGQPLTLTDNGIHLHQHGYEKWANAIARGLDWQLPTVPTSTPGLSKVGTLGLEGRYQLRAAVLKKNDLFFHRFRPENATYLFGFRKHEQGQNAVEIPKFDPLIEAAEAEIDRLKRTRNAEVGTRKAEKDPQIAQIPADSKDNVRGPSDNLRSSAKSADTPPPVPDFTVADGYQIDLWAQNPLLEKPTQMNWDALGRLWVCSSSLYPQIEPGQDANDKILILEDTDRDGKADKSTVFADGLLIPTAVVPDLGSRKSEVGGQKSEKSPPVNPSSDLRPPTSDLFPAACYVGQSTELLRFEDTDGDGKADTKRVVFSGFGTEDTHHLIHTLKWGPDGRLYWNQSIYIHSHLETPWGMVRLNSGGIFAFDPRTERVEVYAKGWCNPWGHAWDQWGQSFTTDGAGGQGISWVIPGAMYFTYENARRIAPSISPGNYPKFCSLELIHSPMFPDDWQGNAVTNDFRAHRVVRFSIEDLSIEPHATDAKGAKADDEKVPDSPSSNPSRPSRPSREVISGYVTKEMPDLVRTNDQSFRPIDIRLGPDGALYVADWSNPVINHGEVDFRDPRRDHHMGRIWRISKKDTPPVKWEPLVAMTSGRDGSPSRPPQSANAGEASAKESSKADGATPLGNEALLEKLLSKSAWEQESAKRILLARAAVSGSSIRKEVHEWQAKAMMRETTDTPQAIQILAIGGALSGPQRTGSIEDGATWEMLTNDSDPRLRVSAMRSLANIPTAQSAALVLEAAMKSPGETGAINARGEEKGGQFDKPTFSDTKDPHYGYAAWLSINDLAKPWTDAIASGAWKADTAERQQQLAWGLRAIDPALAGATISRLFSENKIPLDGTGPWIELLGQAGGAKELRGLLDKLGAAQLPPEAEPRALAALADAARLRNARPEGELRHALDRYLPHATDAKDAKAEEKENPSRPSREAQSAALRLLGAWKVEDAVIDTAAAIDAKTPAEVRFASIDALRSIGSPSSLNLLETLTRPDQDLSIRRAALVAITQVKLDAGVVKAADVLPAITDENAALETWRALLAVKGAPDAFAVKLPRDLPKPVATAGIRAAREAGKNGAKLLAALTPLAGISDTEAKMPKDFKALAAQTKQNGDPARGELIYRRAALTCTVCHAIGGAGGKVGPDMTSLGASAPLDYIIESTLNPTVKVKEGYNAVTLTLKDGTQAVGVQTRETPEEVFLRDATGREQRVPKAQIASTANLGSLMPAGLTDQLQDRDRLDLFAFLGELGKPGPYDASKGNVARAWRLFSGNDAEKVVKGDAALDTALPGYTLVDGRFVKELLEAAAPIAANGAPTMLAVAHFQSSGGKTRLTLTGAEKAWLDGKPLAIGGELAPELPAGVHQLAVRLDVKTFPEFLRAESPDARFLGN